MSFSLPCSGFFPVAINFMRRVPVLGQLLNLPFISGVSAKRDVCVCVCVCVAAARHSLTH